MPAAKVVAQWQNRDELGLIRRFRMSLGVLSPEREAMSHGGIMSSYALANVSRVTRPDTAQQACDGLWTRVPSVAHGGSLADEARYLTRRSSDGVLFEHGYSF